MSSRFAENSHRPSALLIERGRHGALTLHVVVYLPLLPSCPCSTNTFKSEPDCGSRLLSIPGGLIVDVS